MFKRVKIAVKYFRKHMEKKINYFLRKDTAGNTGIQSSHEKE